jgi:hypothetical protein
MSSRGISGEVEKVNYVLEARISEDIKGIEQSQTL